MPLNRHEIRSRAHAQLPDVAYVRRSFKNDAKRVAFLFVCYQALTAPVVATATKRGRSKRAATGT